MASISQKLTLPKFGFFGLSFKRHKILSDYLSDSENNWFILEEEIPDSQSKLTLLSMQDAKIALKAGETVYKLTQSIFSVNLHFEELTLADGNTLTVNAKAGVKISDPERFFRRHARRMAENMELTEDSLCDLWEAAFYNVLQVEAHKLNLENWKSGLTGATIAAALQRYYFAPMALKYIDGTSLEFVESVEGNSPSEEKRLQEELAKQQKEFEEEQQRRISAQNKAEHEAKLEAMREQIRLKELEIKNKEQERINQEAAYQRRLEEEKRKAEQERLRKQDELRIALANTNKWKEISDNEKAIAIDFSALMNNQAEINSVEMKDTAVSVNSILYQGVLGQWNALRKGASLEFAFTPSKSGFVTIINLGTSGKMTILAPNALTGSDTLSVKVDQGVRYNFPKSIMPDLDADSFLEDSSSGLEGIYVVVTKKPLFNFAKTGDLTQLPELSYDKVQALINQLKSLDSNSWCAGCLEFQVVR